MRDRTLLIKIGVLWGVFALFFAYSIIAGYEPGLKSGENLLSFTKTMAGILPPAFLLVGLFNAWVKREVVERYLGKGSGVKGYLWAIILAGTMVGGLFVALPLCHVLRKKGASLGVVFTFLNASAICRVPMTIFEASFLGLEFTLIRFAVSIPLLILAARMMALWLGEDFEISEGISKRA
ncbi:MAG: permease [Thermovirgaceae bacterium]|nr:permease [Thermovirgaceae bacterium]